MSRDEFESLLQQFTARFNDLTWRAWHAKIAPETTDVEISLGWINCYVILTPYADKLWVDINGATFPDLDGTDAGEFFESLFSDRVAKTYEEKGPPGELAELKVLGEGKDWTSGSA